MKKFKTVIFTAIIALFMMPVLVKADMGAPVTKPYDVVITNPDGITIGTGSRKVTIPFDTRVTVNYEYEQDGELYGSVNYNDVYGEIKISDTKMYTTEIDLSQFDKADNFKLYVFKEGAYLYNGPSTAYGKVKGNVMIPAGTTITYTYHDDMWALVEYKGTKGWIYFYSMGKMYSNVDLSVATPIDSNNKLFAITEITEIYKDPYYSENVEKVNIPAGTELTYDLYNSAGRSKYVHIKYKGVEGWASAFNSAEGVESGLVAETSCSEGIVIEDVAIYSKYGDASSSTGEKINKGAKVRLKYSFKLNDYIWNFVNYEGKDVWVAVVGSDPEDYMTIAYNNEYYTTYNVISDTVVYEEPSSVSAQIGTIKAGEKIDADYIYYNDGNWVYVEKAGTKGWISTDSKAVKYDSYKQRTTCKANVATPDPEDDKKDDDKKDKKEGKKENNLLKAAIIAGAISLVIALTVVVIIVLVNKKKKNK